LPAGLPGPPERAQCFGERLIGQLGPAEVDRASDEDVEAGVTGASCNLGRQPGLADARLPGDEDGRAASGVRRGECALELLELASPSHEHLARASHLPASIAQLAVPR
jgi:hypothetical protein